MTEETKPILLVCSVPASGHLMPVKAISKALIARGYEVTFVTGSTFGPSIKDIGATFFPLEGLSDYDDDIEKHFPDRENYAPGLPRFLFDLEHIFVRSMISQWETQQKALKQLREQYPGRKVVLLSEGAFLGTIPTLSGAPGLLPDATLALGGIPVVLNSRNIPPFGLGLPPDNSPDGHIRVKAMQDGFLQTMAGPIDLYRGFLKDIGSTVHNEWFFDTIYLLPDRFIQFCPPSVEYPRPDAPDTIRFAGGLPHGHRDPMTNPPSWWSEVADNPNKKRIVFVSQGTVQRDYTDLIIPTMEALKDEQDVLVVVALGKKGAKLPENHVAPENARIADFIPFDEVLPHSDVFVTNGGYGGFQHGVSNGTPLAVGGATEDKPDVACRAEWCGIGINLKSGTPTPETIKEAVKALLTDPKYKNRALELQEEMKSFDSISVLIENMNEVLAEKK
ncbi:hypothetical protein BP6252_04281 [Coleophoma cylindrospora]|uniref:Erythromycin biosynthesis protein CIII-like C-terminal domain-containing protein n=1 Tax=Coleophoma cylindrospora TaxID=1849047 RepID=A0A3D8S014_9HELO|nr:hypothetical protein BP6252_04281 [Coleophoma cylindrospora]